MAYAKKKDKETHKKVQRETEAEKLSRLSAEKAFDEHDEGK